MEKSQEQNNAKKIYQVFIQDEYNNLWMVGFFNNLDDAGKEINKNHLPKNYRKLQKGDIGEYPTMTSWSFDRELTSKDESESIYIRGFIFDREKVQKTLEKLK